MQSIDVKQVNVYTKRLLFSVAEFADIINEIGKDASNYKVADLVFRLHKPIRQFQTQLHKLSGDFNHTFVQVEDPVFPTYEGWKENDKQCLQQVVAKMEPLFRRVNEEVKAVCSVDYIHSMGIKASWHVLEDFYNVLNGNPRQEYL